MPSRNPTPNASVNPHIGFIGTGTLTAAIVQGLRAKSNSPVLHLSPRSETLSLALASEFPNVVREGSNADVVDRSQIVLLGVRPDQLETALQGVAFRPDQTVVSLVATVRCSDVAKLVAPAVRVCRVTPLTTIASRNGPIIAFPSLPEVQALFDGLGEWIAVESEEQVMALGCAAGLVSSFFEVELAVAQWLASRAVAPADASLYVRSLFAAAARNGLEHPDLSLSELVAAHQTAGGLNEHARARLQASGWFEQIDCALAELSALSLTDRRSQT